MTLLKPLLLLALLMACESFQDRGSTPRTFKDWRYFFFGNTSQTEEVALNGREIQVWLSNEGSTSDRGAKCDDLTFHVLKEDISLQKVTVSMCKSHSFRGRPFACFEVEGGAELQNCGYQNLARLRFERFNGNLTVYRWIPGASEVHLRSMPGFSQSNFTLRAENKKGTFSMLVLYQDPLPSGGPSWKWTELDVILLATSAILGFLLLMTLLVVIPCLMRKQTKVPEERIYEDGASEQRKVPEERIYDDFTPEQTEVPEENIYEDIALERPLPAEPIYANDEMLFMEGQF